MNKILFIISDLELGGAQRVLINVANHFSKTNHVVILTLYNKKITNAKISSNIKIKNLKFRINSNFFSKIFDYIKLIKLIRKNIRKINPSKIFSFLSTTNIIVILSSFGFLYKLVISERNDLQKQKIPLIWKFLRLITYNLPFKVSANSKNCILELENFVFKKKIIYLPNILSTQSKNNNINKKRKKILLAVGRLTYQKGFDILIHAFKESMLYKKGWKLIILGEGEDKLYLKKLIKDEGLEKSIILNGFKYNINDYYTMARIFVLSSRYEGMPNALIEAISYSLPTIVSDSVKGPLFFLRNGHSCITYKNLNKLDLAKKINLLASNRQLQKEISLNALEVIKKEFSQKYAFNIWDNLINE